MMLIRSFSSSRGANDILVFFACVVAAALVFVETKIVAAYLYAPYDVLAPCSGFVVLCM